LKITVRRQKGHIFPHMWLKLLDKCKLSVILCWFGLSNPYDAARPAGPLARVDQHHGATAVSIIRYRTNKQTAFWLTSIRSVDGGD
jgi:hypothetical protein